MRSLFGTRTSTTAPAPVASHADEALGGATQAGVVTHAAFVRAAYLGVLGREPDEDGARAYREQLRLGTAPETMVRSLVDSAEFAASRRPDPPLLMENAAPNPVDVAVDAATAARLWDGVARSWTRLGDVDPYWSVVTDPRWRKEHMSAQDALAAFYETGRPDMHRLDAWFARNGVTVPEDGTCAEYGCGVGRVTRLLARRFRTVRAFDISAPHLAAAEARLTAEGIRNVEYVLVRGPGELSALAGCDLFFSFIVLQHSPPPVIAAILGQAMAGLRPGGLAFFQVPIWSHGYAFEAGRYLATEREGMEMHCIPQRAVFALAREHGCEAIEVQPDGCAGPDYVSNIFLLRKRG